jgi:HAD superfamily hydrolase (TIGR01509 family)
MTAAVIFDVDGTLIDSVDLHTDAWDKAFRDFGFTFPREKLRHGIGKGGDQYMPDFLTAAQMKEVGEKLKQHRGEIGIRDFLPRAKAFPNVRELLQRIKDNGQHISLGSSASGPEAEWHKRILQCDDLIDERTSSENARQGKPEPDIFLAAIEKLPGIPKEQVVVVGDSPWDMIAAGKAGLRGIGMLSGGFPASELHDAGAIEVYKDPADLLQRYDTSALAR